MRGLQRLPKPAILEKKESEWLNKFIKSGKARPQNSQYAHAEIVDTLKSISACKCFYCETKLAASPSEVDHQIEVSLDKDGAFAWENLYLACENCNGKIRHDVISIEDALDPCRNSDAEIQKEIGFDKEVIISFSQKGYQTLKKYKLDRDKLNYKRSKELTIFLIHILNPIHQRCISEKREMNVEEASIIQQVVQKNHSYSLMFISIFKKLNLPIMP